MQHPQANASTAPCGYRKRVCVRALWVGRVTDRRAVPWWAGGGEEAAERVAGMKRGWLMSLMVAWST